jgi:hypothetical protein
MIIGVGFDVRECLDATWRVKRTIPPAITLKDLFQPVGKKPLQLYCAGAKRQSPEIIEIALRVDYSENNAKSPEWTEGR